MSRFIDPIPQPEREVRPYEPAVPNRVDPGTEDDPSQPVRTGPVFVPLQDHDLIRDRFTRARDAVTQLEAEAAVDMAEALHIAATPSRPQLHEATKILQGTHPVWSRIRGLAPVRDPNPVVDLDTYERALRILRRADRITLGFDLQQIVDPEYDGTVVPEGPIYSAADAAGETDLPPGERAPIDDVLEQQTTFQRLEMVIMAFIALVWQSLNQLANMLEGLAERVERALSFRILGRRIGVGKFVAKPLFWLAKLCRRLAKLFEQDWRGQDPTPADFEFEPGDFPPPEEEEPPPPNETPPTPPDFGDYVETASPLDGAVGGEVYRSPDDPEPDPTRRPIRIAGITFLGAASTVVRAVRNQAQAEVAQTATSSSALARALRKHDRARAAREALDAYATITAGLGVDLTSATGPSSPDTTQPRPHAPGESVRFEEC